MTEEYSDYDESIRDSLPVLEELAGEGRVEVERTGRARCGPILETPEGTVTVRVPAGSAWTEGADFTRRWFIGPYRLDYSIDRTPGNRTHTVVVKDHAE